MDRTLVEQVAWILSRCVPDRDSDCLLWLGYQHEHKHGNCLWNGKTKPVHRLILTAHEPPPFEGAMALHDPYLCRYKTCCNLEHLLWGTRKDMAEASKVRKRLAEEGLGDEHFHPYVASDDGRVGDYAPTAFQIIARSGWPTRSGANKAALAREPDPSRRIVLGCRRPDCKVRETGR